MIAFGCWALLTAGVGFYLDVAWHVGRGRDKELFTAPHTAIVIGLAGIALAAVIGIVTATLQRIDTGIRVANLRIPWSAIPVGLLGLLRADRLPARRAVAPARTASTSRCGARRTC